MTLCRRKTKHRFCSLQGEPLHRHWRAKLFLTLTWQIVCSKYTATRQMTESLRVCEATSPGHRNPRKAAAPKQATGGNGISHRNRTESSHRSWYLSWFVLVSDKGRINVCQLVVRDLYDVDASAPGFSCEFAGVSWCATCVQAVVLLPCYALHVLLNLADYMQSLFCRMAYRSDQVLNAGMS